MTKNFDLKIQSFLRNNVSFPAIHFACFINHEIVNTKINITSW